jgi:PadR family transcriptional regulator PadR
MAMRISHQTKRILQAFLDAPAEEIYGFALSQATGLKAGTLYPVLQRLLEEGWLTARWEDIDESAEGRRRRRYYRLTADGEIEARAAVTDESAGLRQLMPGWV